MGMICESRSNTRNKIISVEMGVVSILLPNGLMVNVDEFMYEKIEPYKWHSVRSSNGTPYASSEQYQNNVLKRIAMHRFLMGCPDNLVVDHINKNTLDNRLANLRICTKQQNLQNRAFRCKNDTSKYKGVAMLKNGKYKMTFSMQFDSEVDAARAYNKACLSFYGEFASPNIID